MHFRDGLDGWFLLDEWLLCGGRGWSFPVVQHLQGENAVEGEPDDEAVQDELVVDFLEGREDAG